MNNLDSFSMKYPHLYVLLFFFRCIFCIIHELSIYYPSMAFSMDFSLSFPFLPRLGPGQASQVRAGPGLAGVLFVTHPMMIFGNLDYEFMNHNIEDTFFGGQY